MKFTNLLKIIITKNSMYISLMVHFIYFVQDLYFLWHGPEANTRLMCLDDGKVTLWIHIIYYNYFIYRWGKVTLWIHTIYYHYYFIYRLLLSWKVFKNYLINVLSNGMFGKLAYWEILAYFDINRELDGQTN